MVRPPPLHHKEEIMQHTPPMVRTLQAHTQSQLSHQAVFLGSRMGDCLFVINNVPM